MTRLSDMGALDIVMWDAHENGPKQKKLLYGYIVIL